MHYINDAFINICITVSYATNATLRHLVLLSEVISFWSKQSDIVLLQVLVFQTYLKKEYM